MSKRNILTAIGIALSFAIAIGGWALVGRLIDIRSDMLMSATGVAPIAMPIAVPSQSSDSAAGGYIHGRPLLTEEEMVSILRNHNAAGREMPHEPTPEQISMAEAIEIGRNWLSFIAQELNIPIELFQLESYNINAHLSQNQQRSGGAFLPPAYSFWTVTVRTPVIVATMLINAVEGQVWNTEVTAVGFLEPWTVDAPYLFSGEQVVAVGQAFLVVSQEHISGSLGAFVSYLGIAVTDGNYETIIREGMYAGAENIVMFERFADGAAYIAVHVTGTPVIDVLRGQSWIVTSFSIYVGVDSWG